MRPGGTFVNFTAQGKLFSEAISSDFGDFVRERVDFYGRHPEIGEMILADQTAHAFAKKQARARKAEEQRRETRPLEGFGESAPAGCSLELGDGTPADGTGGGVRPGDGARARRRALPQGFARSRGGLVTAGWSPP